MSSQPTHRANTDDGIPPGGRFAFGANWRKFLPAVDDRRIGEARLSLVTMLGGKGWAGARFLDVGSGSGLFSLAANGLGAEVVSFDADEESVRCTRELRRLHGLGDAAWTIESGSVLDTSFLDNLGTFDIVYAWGVLHHTGDLAAAMDNVVRCVGQGGRLFLAIYNDQGVPTRVWTGVKRRYNGSGPGGRAVLLALCGAYLGAKAAAAAAFRRLGPGRGRSGDPGDTRDTRDSSTRGMAWWRDVVDWVGGWPFQTATPEAVFDFYRDRGFVLEEMITRRGRLGCNQFVFSKK